MKTKYIFNKTTSVNPVNRKNLSIQVNYDREAIVSQSYVNVGVKNLTFRREDVKNFYDWVQNSSEGIFYAPSFDIELSKKGVTNTIEMYFDLTDGFQYSKEGAEVSIKLKKSLDWLNDKVDGFTFESIYLDTTYPLSAKIKAKTFYIPYVISEIPKDTQAFTALITIVFLSMQVASETDTLTSYFGPNAASPFTAIPIFIGFALHIVYLITLLATIISTIEMFFVCIIQPVKYHAAILLVDLIEIVCDKLGIKFQSSIYQSYPFNQIALMPEKYAPVQSSNTHVFSIGNLFNINYIVGGYIQPTPSKQQGYPIKTGGDILRLAKRLINGKLIVQDIAGDTTLVMERRDYNPSTAKYQLPDIRQDWNGYNTKEFFATTVIRFEKDLNDKNCIDQYQGTILQANQSLVTSPDPILSLTKNERRIEIEAARGIYKYSLTFPEQLYSDFISALNAVVNGLISIVNGIIDALNAIVSVINAMISILKKLGIVKINKLKPIKKISYNQIGNSQAGNRIGSLLLENDMVNTQKILMVDTQNSYQVNGQKVCKLHTLNGAIVNTLYLWNRFYCIDSFVPVSNSGLPAYPGTPGIDASDIGKHNQCTLWSPSLNSPSDQNKVSLSFDEAQLLINDNNFIDNTGTTATVDSLNWHYEEEWMDLQYRKNELYTKNLKIQITLPDGN